MFQVTFWMDDKLVFRDRTAHLPKKGDTIKSHGQIVGVVKNITWCHNTPGLVGYQVVEISLKEHNPK